MWVGLGVGFGVGCWWVGSGMGCCGWFGVVGEVVAEAAWAFVEAT